MKRMLLTLLGAIVLVASAQARLSSSQVRTETRFLTDKMAYELNLSTLQYGDVYEINYDFINGIRYLVDDIQRGDPRAMDRYYELLDIRNDDLRWVLNNRQYTSFMGATHFFRPLYVSGGRCHFRIYITYTNRRHFYYPLPRPCLAYRGGHARPAFGRPSHYRGRYNHPHYRDTPRLYGPAPSRTVRRSDFGPAPEHRTPSRRSVEHKREEVRKSRSATPSPTPVRRTSVKSEPRKSATPAVRRTESKPQVRKESKPQVRRESKPQERKENKNARRSEVAGKRT